MTRYQYARVPGWSDIYHVIIHGVTMGRCYRIERPNTRPLWRVILYMDPTTLGTGRTRDDAVDDVYEQVGGPD